MANELSRATVLCCPDDIANTALAKSLFDSIQENEDTQPYYEALKSAWSRWPINGGSYEMLGANLHRYQPDTLKKVIARCRFHGHVTYGDGSVLRSDNQGGFQP
jgi:hypothetical protein